MQRDIYKLEVEHFPFESVFQVINYYKYSNPARSKSVTLEQTGGRQPGGASFTGTNEQDIYASVIKAFQYLFKIHSEPYKKQVFCLYYWDSGKLSRLSIKDVAQIVGVSPYKARKTINIMDSTLERELVRRQLIRPI